MTPSAAQKLDMHRRMRRIRQLQLAIEAVYHLDQMKTPVHLCVGQEATAVGVCAHLTPADYISSNHRGHAHYLAKGGDFQALVADCGWKTGGVTAEIAALAVEKGFGLLKAPVARVACPDLPTPSGFTLGQAFYPGQAEITAAVRRVLK
ncbi:MAG: thiamine pyrophosphate-dependent enzyme [Pseudomonadota bacterium]